MLRPSVLRLTVLLVSALLTQGRVWAQTQPATPTPDPHASAAPDSRLKRTALVVSGAAVALFAHEAGHLAFDVAFDADPVLERVEFHGIPFFALTHRETLSTRREAIVASAGFWVQHATSEWLLTTVRTCADGRRLREGRLRVQRLDVDRVCRRGLCEDRSRRTRHARDRRRRAHRRALGRRHRSRARRPRLVELLRPGPRKPRSGCRGA